jgi:hypothetical protein
MALAVLRGVPMEQPSSFYRSVKRRLFPAAMLAIPLATLAFAGCGGAVQEGTSSTGGGGSHSSSSTTTSTSSSSTSSGGSCSTDAPCQPGGACVFQPGSCQKGAMGVCQTFFQCDGSATGPLCGCDGKVVEGEYADCAVWKASKPYDNAAPCQIGTFPCGPKLACKRNSDVCVEKLPGVPGPTSYECVTYDKANHSCLHGIPACDCIDLAALGGPMGTTSCKVDADNQETVTVALP